MAVLCLPAAMHSARAKSWGVCPCRNGPAGLPSRPGCVVRQGGVMEAMRRHLLPIATVITPNVPEASALLGRSPAPPCTTRPAC